MKLMKFYLYFLVLFLGAGCLLLSTCSNGPVPVHPKTVGKPNQKPAEKLQQKARFLKEKFISGQYNPHYCFLVDYSLPSGKKRFFIWDIQKGQAVAAGLCCHGGCNGDLLSMPPRFSKVSGSGCSADGVYAIGRRDWSGWGKNYKYWLTGLATSNNNSVERNIVLHAWEGIPDHEIYPDIIAHSDGCPTVSVNFLDKLDLYIRASKKPILLYIFKN